MMSGDATRNSPWRWLIYDVLLLRSEALT